MASIWELTRLPMQYAFYGPDSKKYFWDLAPLCSERGYIVSTADNRTYGFNSELNCRISKQVHHV